MEYAILGKTGRRVSRLGFGGATAGLRNYLEPFDPKSPRDRDAIVASVHKALKLGINYFDTAPAYGDGAGESIFGEALQCTSSDRIFLATKVGVREGQVVRESLETSLQRLRRDQIDLLQIHGTQYTPEHAECVLKSGGVLDQMESLKQEGLVLHIGFTCEAENPALYQFIETGRFDVLQMCYNFIFQHPYYPGWKSGALFQAQLRHMGIVTMRSTTSGIFQKWIQRVNPGNTFDYTQALIQFVLSNPVVDVALVGMRSSKQVTENAALCDDLDGRVDLEDLFTRYV
jgi:aryl-alcohol dehydrogenase-like predicted oxidoreductase